MKRLAPILVAAAALVIAKASLGADFGLYAPPAGWQPYKGASPWPRGLREWTRGGEVISWYVDPSSRSTPRSENDVRAAFEKPGLPTARVAIDSIVRRTDCPHAVDGWVVRYHFLDSSHSVIAVLEDTKATFSRLSYSFDSTRLPDSTAAQSLLQYCVPVARPESDPMAPPAKPFPKINRDMQSPVSMYGFEYRAPIRWAPFTTTSPSHVSPKTNQSDVVLWRRGEDALFLAVLERSSGQVKPFDPTAIRNDLVRLGDNVSTTAAKGCDDRPVVVAAYRRYSVALDDPFALQPHYYTSVYMAGSAALSDPAVVSSFGSLCFRGVLR